MLTAGLALGLLLAEILLRLFAPQIFPIHPAGLYVTDEQVGYVLAPDFTGPLRRAEFDTVVNVDENGLRRTVPAPTGTAPPLRVVCLGDSLTFGFGVEDGETYASRLQVLLAASHPDRRVEVENAGVPGYGSADQLAFLRSRGAALAPDLVIVQFLPVNDFHEDRWPAVTWADVRDGKLVAKGEDLARMDATLALRVKRMLKLHSHLARLLFDRAGYLLMRLGALGALETVLAESGEDFTEEDARRTSQSLAGIAATARELDAATLFFYSTGQDRVIVDPDSPLRSRAFLEEAARAAGVPWADLAEWMRRRTDRMDLYYPQDGHWTGAGHRAVAEFLAARIAEHDLLRTGYAPGGAVADRHEGY